MTTETIANPYRWLRGAPFDLTLIVGVAALALGSGALVVAEPSLFPLVLVLDLWLLGYHHVVSTFTRLSFDGESLREHRFLVFGLPLIILAAAMSAVALFGGWILATTYLYWQWFHYTRQSYGIERVYRRKAADRVQGGERLAKWVLYLVPLWGILYRSYQAPDRFLGLELKTLPVPRWLVLVAGAAAVATLGAWLVDAGRGVWREGRPLGHVLFLASHHLVFIVGYVGIESIDHGWLVVNVWHNAQYILFVWLYNTNRFRGGVEPGKRFVSTLSQPQHWPYYFLTCLGISTVVYFGLEQSLALLESRFSLPLFLIAYQTINFHHYVVDGLIWKVRKKTIRRNLGLAG